MKEIISINRVSVINLVGRICFKIPWRYDNGIVGKSLVFCKAIVFLGYFIMLTGCESQTTSTFPGEDWVKMTPESQGIDSRKLADAIEYLTIHSKHNKNKELIIIRNGYMVYGGENIDSVHNIWSCSKTFTSAVLGVLTDDGILDLDEKAANYEPLLENYYSNVTFRHFATMTSGYSAVGRSRWNDENEDWSDTPYDPSGQPYFEPGTAYAYWDEAQMMFGRVLTQVIKRPMIDFLKERVTNVMNMGDWEWHTEQDVNGIPINNGCTFVHLNAKKLARWGLLFLNDGNWDGQQLLSKEWVKLATSVQVPQSIPTGNTDRKGTIGSGCYGFNWWVNGMMPNGEMKLPGAPEGCFFASGLNNNKCIVVPEWNIVVVRMGEDGHPDKPDLVYGTFLNKLGQSIIQ